MTPTPSVSMSHANGAEQPAEAHSCRVYLKLLNPADFARNIITEFCSWTRPKLYKAALLWSSTHRWAIMGPLCVKV